MKTAIIDRVAIEQANEDLAALLDPFGGGPENWSLDWPPSDPAELAKLDKWSDEEEARLQRIEAEESDPNWYGHPDCPW